MNKQNVTQILKRILGSHFLSVLAGTSQTAFFLCASRLHHSVTVMGGNQNECWWGVERRRGMTRSLIFHYPLCFNAWLHPLPPMGTVREYSVATENVIGLHFMFLSWQKPVLRGRGLVSVLFTEWRTLLYVTHRHLCLMVLPRERRLFWTRLLSELNVGGQQLQSLSFSGLVLIIPHTSFLLNLLLQFSHLV